MALSKVECVQRWRLAHPKESAAKARNDQHKYYLQHKEKCLLINRRNYILRKAFAELRAIEIY